MAVVGADPTRHTDWSKKMSIMKVGTKVLHKETKDEHKLIGVRQDEGGETGYTFERKEGGDTVLKYVREKDLEATYYFMVEDHPSEREAERKKTKKTREKVTQPAPEGEISAFNLLN